MRDNNTGVNSMFDVFDNFNYLPPANTSQYGIEPYNNQSQLDTMQNPAAFFTMPTQQASTAINTTANTNAVQNSNVPSNIPANNSTAQATTGIMAQNPIETIISDIETALNNLFKSIFGK